MAQKKKPNKAERAKKKAEHAETFGEGFDHGYIMGYEQGFKDAAIKGQRNAIKWASFGR